MCAWNVTICDPWGGGPRHVRERDVPYDKGLCRKALSLSCDAVRDAVRDAQRIVTAANLKGRTYP